MLVPLLAINPGITSTKLSLFLDESEIRGGLTSHTRPSWHPSPDRRTSCVPRTLRTRLLTRPARRAPPFHAVVGRAAPPTVPSGVTRDQQMLRELARRSTASTPANLGALLAHAAAREAGCRPTS